jgi:hypothetical protein
MHIDLEGYAANLYGEVLSASYCPIHATIGCFHLNTVLCIDVSTDFFSKVMVDDHNLGSWVEDPMFGTEVAN